MRNWLLFLFLVSAVACSKPDNQNPTPTPQQPQPLPDEMNGWQKITANVNDYFADIAFSTPAIGYLAGVNATYKSTDSGKTWAVEPSITTRPVTINFLNSQYGYAVGMAPMSITRNGGNSWQTKNPIPAVDVCFVSPSTGFATGTWPLMKTIDTGNTWQRVGNFTSANSFSVYFLNEQQGWWATKDSVYQTADGGLTWVQKKVANSQIFTVFFTDQSNGWLTADTSVYRTTNGGTTWSKVTVGVPTFDIQFLNPQIGYVSVLDGVFKTTDGGLTWVRDLKAPLNSFPELIFLDQNTGWVTGNGNIIYRWKK